MIGFSKSDSCQPRKRFLVSAQLLCLPYMKCFLVLRCFQLLYDHNAHAHWSSFHKKWHRCIVVNYRPFSIEMAKYLSIFYECYYYHYRTSLKTLIYRSMKLLTTDISPVGKFVLPCKEYYSFYVSCLFLLKHSSAPNRPFCRHWGDHKEGGFAAILSSLLARQKTEGSKLPMIAIRQKQQW